MKVEFDDPKLGRFEWTLPPDVVENIEEKKTFLRAHGIHEQQITEIEEKHRAFFGDPIRGTMALVVATEFLNGDLQYTCFEMIKERLCSMSLEVRKMINDQGDNLAGPA